MVGCSFCGSDESGGHHACMNGHLTTANQSEIRFANLVSVVVAGQVAKQFALRRPGGSSP